QNLAKLLSSLNETAAEQHQSLLIGVEGAFRPFDFSCFRAFLNKATVRKIADHFLETNRFAAPSFVGITAKDLVARFIGVDDSDGYARNRSAYLESRKEKPALESWLKAEQMEVEAEEAKNDNASLLAYDARRRMFVDGKIGFGAYAAYLVEEAEKYFGE